MTKEILECVSQAERFLRLRDHNNNELREKLRKKDYSDAVIDEAFEFLSECGELSEDRYIRIFVRSNNRRHPEGKTVVFQRLLEKNADKESVKTVLDEIYTEEYQEEMLTLAYKKVRKKTSDAVKIKQMLIRAGFSISSINRLQNSSD